MKLDAPFYRLPLRFEVERLREEVLQFGEEDWRSHPHALIGNSALVLVSAYGGINDAVQGPMLPTAHLGRCPYLRQTLAAFDTVIGRSRLMRVDGGERVAPHSDIHYYWRNRVRVHIPIVTDPAVRFTCGGHEAHMAPGEAWLLDTWRVHGVVNASPIRRIHLVFDTVGSATFWDLLSQGETSTVDRDNPGAGPRTIAYDPQADARFSTEQYNLPIVMSPAELETLVADAIADATPAGNEPGTQALSRLAQSTRRCTYDWRAVWAVHGDGASGWSEYGALQQQLFAALAELPDDLHVRSNGQRLSRVLQSGVAAALNPSLAGQPPLLRPQVADLLGNSRQPIAEARTAP